MLWVLGDTEAESTLLALYDERKGDDSGSARDRGEIAFALTRCGTVASRGRVLDYARSVGPLVLSLAEDMLWPLVGRGVLTEQDLADIVVDGTATESGREACCRALALFAPERWGQLFRSLVEQGAEGRLARVAAVGIGLGGSVEAVSLFLERVRDCQPDDVPVGLVGGGEEDRRLTFSGVATAAAVLAELGQSAAAPLMERAVERAREDQSAVQSLAASLGRLGSPSSLPVLLDLASPTQPPQLRNTAVAALGGYLPNPAAAAAVQGALDSGSGGYADRGDQLDAIRTLTRHDPRWLVDAALARYPLGHLDSSARQLLALNLDDLVAAEEVGRDDIARLVAALASDRDLWVREMLMQFAERAPRELAETAAAKLVADADPWVRACGVRLAGTLDLPAVDVGAARFDTEQAVRDAADTAVEARRVREALTALAHELGQSNGGRRVSVFLALREHGDEHTMRLLGELYPEGTEERELVEAIKGPVACRRRKEHQERAREADRMVHGLDAVRFD
jgi:hypothetical protein